LNLLLGFQGAAAALGRLSAACSETAADLREASSAMSAEVIRRAALAANVAW
jgi:uncharacterized membrane protein